MVAPKKEDGSMYEVAELSTTSNTTGEEQSEEEENQNETFNHIVEEINNNKIELLDNEKISLKIKERNQLDILGLTNNIYYSPQYQYYIWLLVTNNFICSFLHCQYNIWVQGKNEYNIWVQGKNEYNIWVQGKNEVLLNSCANDASVLIDSVKISIDTATLVAEAEGIKEGNQISSLQLTLEVSDTFHLDDIYEKQIYRDWKIKLKTKQSPNRLDSAFNYNYRNIELEEIQQPSSEFMSGQKSARINIYISVIRNETYRMMANIDIITSQAMELLGPERTQIFLDLLADKLLIFISALAIPGFVPNMAKPAIRDQVISLFEYPRVVMNQVMTSLLSCPDSERLQKMPEPVFIALIEHVIEFSLESKSNIAKGLCLEGKRLIVDNLQEFKETLGEKIPDKLKNRLNTGHEVVVYRFGDKNERSQPAEKRENRLIHSIYFPSDCRLFIYIPTEKGSYWHEMEMQRTNWFKLRNTI